MAPEEAETLTRRPGAAQLIQGGRPMTGYLLVEPAGDDSEADLEFWINRCLAFNPRAKASKK